MKQIFTLIFLILSLNTVTLSQVRVGLIGGPLSSSIDEKNQLEGWESNTQPFYQKRSGLHLGFLVAVPLNTRQSLFFQPGFIFTNKGNRYYKQYDTTVYKPSDSVFFSRDFFTNYIDIPLNLAYRLKLSKKTGFMISAGPYISFFYSGKEITGGRSFKRNLNASPDYDLEASLKPLNEEATIQSGNDEKKVQTVDAGYNIRAGFDIGNVAITGFYSQGLTNFYRANYPGEFRHKVVGASLVIWLNKLTAPEPKVLDKDGDGVNDQSDKCPDLAGLAKYLGCPPSDFDSDGVPDESDSCRMTAGLVKYHGCPVPDTDGDGINDELDQCVDIAGTTKYKGCPIPDTDKDSVDDENDNCPGTAGTVANNGCPEIKTETIEKIKFVAKNIFFETGSDSILQSSLAGLDEVAEILIKNPQTKLNIEGHSDSTGLADKNLILSTRRAEAVKTYLVSKNVDAARLQAEGFGSSRPVSSENTPAGQAANRRVELILVEK